jgi:hypothetical protein
MIIYDQYASSSLPHLLAVASRSRRAAAEGEPSGSLQISRGSSGSTHLDFWALAPGWKMTALTVV